MRQHSKKAGYLGNGEHRGRSSLLRHPVFKRTFSAYSLAVFGDWFDVIAIQVLIGYRWQVSAMEIALVPVSMAVPGILLGTVAGVVTDRLDRLKLMRVCDLLTAMATLALLWAPSIGWLLPILALRAALGTFNVPAQQALTRQVLREENLLDASSLNGLVGQLSRVAGPLLGAALLALVSPQACIAVNAAARLLSYGILKTMPRGAAAMAAAEAAPEQAKTPAQSGSAKPPFFAALREGWQFVRRTRMLRNLLLFAFLGMLVIQTIDFQFVSLIRVISPHDEGALGWLLASSGLAAAGMTAANMKLARLRSASWGMKLGSSYTLLGLSIGLLGLIPPGAPTSALLLAGILLGAGNGLFMVTFNVMLQQHTPPAMIGRIFGIQNTLLGTVMIVAPPLGGGLVQHFGPALVFVLAGLFVLLLGLLGLMFRRTFW
ncbi:MFS transporter [Saccharibacillus sp. O16]|nr:MFS transporter [Saccharibacillus sp. O16]